MKLKPVLLILLLVIIAGGAIFYFTSKNRKRHNGTTTTIPSTVEGSDENHPFGFAGPSAPDDFNKIKALGVKYARESIEWGKIEPKDNQFDFSSFNGSGKLAQYGLEIIVRLKLGQIWATKCGNNPAQSADCPPKDLGPWSEKGYSPLLYDFIYKALEYAKSHGNQFEYIVVGNEVNSLLFWHGTSEEYLKTRTTVYKAVKDINATYNTSYKVVDNGFASGVWGGAVMRENYCQNDKNKKAFALNFAKSWFSRTYEGPQTEQALAQRLNCSSSNKTYLMMKEAFKKDPNLGEPSFDLMAYHFYEPWDTQEPIITWIKEEMKKNGYSCGIMNTEGGFRDTLHLYSNTPTLAQEVANDIPKLHTVAFENGVKTWLWLPFTERDDTYKFYGLEWKGLISTDLKELPAYTSYKTMVQKLDGFKTVEKVTGFPNPYIYKFTFKSKSPVYVLWSTKTETINFSSKIKDSAKITKTDGSTQTVNTSSISTSQEPIYLEQN